MSSAHSLIIMHMVMRLQEMSWFAASFASVPVTFLACEGKAVSHRHPLSGALAQGSFVLAGSGLGGIFQCSELSPAPLRVPWHGRPTRWNLSLGTMLQQLPEQPHHHRVTQQPGMSPVTASVSLLQQILCLLHSETHPWTELTCESFCW